MLLKQQTFLKPSLANKSTPENDERDQDGPAKRNLCLEYLRSMPYPHPPNPPFTPDP